MKRKRRGRKAYWLMGLTIMLAVLAVVYIQQGEERTSHSSSSDDTSSVSSEQQQILDTAAREAAQYDYDQAIQQLENAEGSEQTKTQEAIDSYRQKKEKLVSWDSDQPIPHLFFHSLIVDEERAFDGDGMSQGYRDNMVTVDEFQAILEDLYERDYVLVTMDDIAQLNADGTMTYQDLQLPPGKKPIVLSQDDLSYYEYMDGDGFADKLILDEQGDVTNTYIQADGETQQGSYDMVPLIDDFVQEHPDFSYHGHKGVVAVTGYNGVLGYRTSESEYGPESNQPNPDLEVDQEQAQQVAEAMKAEGWTFASHTWGHLNVQETSLAQLQTDTQRWKDEVAPLVGDTSAMIFAFGSDLSDWHPYHGAKYEWLRDQGYRYFANVDASTEAWKQLEPGYFRQARINVDGMRMREALQGQTDVLDPFFDVEDVYSDQR
ncbi:hypothetical protein CHL76_15635 [Marinococcus halophilus]|nr:polysaccharide deacetylase family protein [Marinococcus halophilus]OZT78870.1 hypothetical protein CHL76_15635 [Marinococcus halophilus]